MEITEVMEMLIFWCNSTSSICEQAVCYKPGFFSFFFLTWQWWGTRSAWNSGDLLMLAFLPQRCSCVWVIAIFLSGFLITGCF